MSRIAYVNGQFVPHRAAAVHIEDRGYQFSDGVYEVVLLRRGRFVDLEPHLDRLDRSLDALQIAHPMKRAPLRLLIGELVRRNRLRDGLVYMQVTRGVARRDHAFPVGVKPAFVMTARRLKVPSREAMEEGASVITIPDERWARRDIKSISLLPNILGKQQARAAGAYEAWQVEGDGMVTEGTSTNAWIVTDDGALITHSLGHEILSGITRATVSALARRGGLVVHERSFSVEEAKSAREAFVTSATSFVTPVTEIDGVTIGNGRAGSFAMSLFDAYVAYADGADGVDEAGEAS